MYVAYGVLVLALTNTPNRKVKIYSLFNLKREARFREHSIDPVFPLKYDI